VIKVHGVDANVLAIAVPIGAGCIGEMAAEGAGGSGAGCSGLIAGTKAAVGDGDAPDAPLGWLPAGDRSGRERASVDGLGLAAPSGGPAE